MEQKGIPKKIVLRLNDVLLAPYNPRKISKAERAKLKKSIETFGYKDLMVWNRRTNQIVGGNQRLIVLREDMKWEDAEFIDYLLEASKTDNIGIGITIIAICFGINGDFIDFDLELNEKPGNIIGKYIKLDIPEKESSPTLTFTQETEKKNDETGIKNLVIEGKELAFAREWILNHPQANDSPELKLTLAYIYKWEKDNHHILSNKR